MSKHSGQFVKHWIAANALINIINYVVFYKQNDYFNQDVTQTKKSKLQKEAFLDWKCLDKASLFEIMLKICKQIW